MKNPHAESAAKAVSVAASLVGPPVERSLWRAILTDVHFWVPVVVLAIGLGMLALIS